LAVKPALTNRSWPEPNSPVAYTEVITTDLGHLDGIAHIAKAGADIARFLAASPT
jgi:hypothetical protein